MNTRYDNPYQGLKHPECYVNLEYPLLAMKNALDVAGYFLCCVDREAGDTISHLKLQKLVYYAQAWSLVFRNQPFFAQDIEAWVSGPIVRAVWEKYKVYQDGDIPAPENFDTEFTDDELEVLEEVWSTYGELSAKYLRDLVCSEKPWLTSRHALDLAAPSINMISYESMKSYYANFVEA